MRKDGLVTYLHPDHLGSTSLTTDAGGAKVARVLYYPYGEERYREGTLQTDYQFTGQRREGFGLYDYQARFYDPYLNRFISPDTIVPNPANPQSLNRFAYVYNNPLKYTDPTGHCAKGDKECEYQRCVDQGGDAKICSRQIKGGGGQGQQGGRYLCNSQYGCFDKWHLGTGDPASIIRQVERAIAAGGGTVVVPGTISTPIDGVGLSFVGYYYVSGDADLDAVGVAYAIHQHWSIAFEAWEGTLPGGEATSFAIEDLPSHHVGFFMAANGLSRDQAFALLGEFEETNEDPTRSVKNYSFTPLVQDESGNYSHVSWPEAMQITPIDNGWTHIEWDQEIRYRGQPVVSVSTLGDAGASAGPLLFGCFWRFLGR